MTGKRHDLVKDAVPSVFPWSLTVDRDKDSERSERAKVREGKRLLQSIAGPSAEIKYTVCGRWTGRKRRERVFLTTEEQ